MVHFRDPIEEITDIGDECGSCLGIAYTLKAGNSEDTGTSDERLTSISDTRPTSSSTRYTLSGGWSITLAVLLVLIVDKKMQV